MGRAVIWLLLRAGAITDMERLENVISDLRRRGQEHTLRWWPELSPSQRERLLAELEAIPWPSLAPVIKTHVLGRPELGELRNVEPARVLPHEPRPDQQARYEKAHACGAEIIKHGKVAAFTVAGGQGTRLGFDGPKGCVGVTPVTNKSLFQLFAEMVLAARAKYGAAIAWYIMTNAENHEQTRRFFEANHYFGLPQADVMMFPQGMLPAFDFQGRLLLADKDHLALAPDGHGGSLKALAASGALADMRRRGIEVISYFQVDNPLVKPFDPLFVGLHAETGSEMSTKVARKADDFEKVGNVCLVDGRATVIEYTEFPRELATQRNADGTRCFDAANLAMHLFDAGFVERVAEKAQLPFRRAEKAVPFINERGELIRPTSPNAIKLETFVFDALPLAKTPLLLEVDRAEEFSPVKNATGPDSLETSKRDQVLRACRWLEQAGIAVPRKPDGAPDVTVEIGPKFAMDGEDVVARKAGIGPVRGGAVLALG